MKVHELSAHTVWHVLATLEQIPAEVSNVIESNIEELYMTIDEDDAEHVRSLLGDSALGSLDVDEMAYRAAKPFRDVARRILGPEPIRRPPSSPIIAVPDPVVSGPAAVLASETNELPNGAA